MARVFRKTYSEKLPEGAEIFVKSGKKHARFKRGGKSITALVSQKGDSIIREVKKWYIEYRDENGIKKCVPGYTDRKATDQKAGELERTAEHVRCGYKPKEHDFLNLPLVDQLKDYKRYLLAKSTSEKQARQVHNRALRIIEGCHFLTWANISPHKIISFLEVLRTDTKEKTGISAQTYNWYLKSMKSFCKWMVQEGRAPENPLSHLQGLNVKTDLRHKRRALTEKECRALLKAAQKGKKHRRMSGPDRALLYQTALESGLRANEIRTLKVENCRVESKPPELIVEAAYSKHRREDHQPIPLALAKKLAVHTKGREIDELVFPTMPRADRVSTMLKEDLKAAKISYKDESDRYADFHALRHTYITNLAKSGVHPKVAMDLARHSDINLTMARYSHTVIRDRAEALTALPSLTDGNEPMEQKATGTDDIRPFEQEKQQEQSNIVLNDCNDNAYDTSKKVLKTVVRQRTGGSNPSSSARKWPVLIRYRLFLCTLKQGA